ncbi:hypothetical protein VCHE40_0492B, partial [Vibrio cholerae HE-40]
SRLSGSTKLSAMSRIYRSTSGYLPGATAGSICNCPTKNIDACLKPIWYGITVFNEYAIWHIIKRSRL